MSNKKTNMLIGRKLKSCFAYKNGRCDALYAEEPFSCTDCAFYKKATDYIEEEGEGLFKTDCFGFYNNKCNVLTSEYAPITCKGCSFYKTSAEYLEDQDYWRDYVKKNLPYCYQQYHMGGNTGGNRYGYENLVGTNMDSLLGFSKN